MEERTKKKDNQKITKKIWDFTLKKEKKMYIIEGKYNKDIYEYLINRYDDSDSLKETLFRIYKRSGNRFGK